MNIELRRVKESDKSVLRELLGLYLYDLSSLVDRDPNEHGRFEYRYLDHYWVEPERRAYFTLVDGALAGFVMINAHTVTGAAHAIAEFFVMQRHRRSGVGTEAAHLAFNAVPGTWEVCTDIENVAAGPFWRSTISRYTEGRFQEHPDGLGGWTGPCFTFESR